MILILKQTDVEKRASDAGMSVMQVLNTIKTDFKSADFAEGYFSGLLDDGVTFAIYPDITTFTNKFNYAMSNRNVFEWYVISLNIQPESEME